MPPRSLSIDDSQGGSAAVEFILMGLLMLVPLVYLIVSLGVIQSQSLGAEAGARHLARAAATAGDRDDAAERTGLILAAVADEYGLDEDAVSVSLSCRPSSASCPAAGATLTVTVRTRAALPLVPPVLGLDRMASLPIEASATHKVSRFWGAG